MIQNTLSTILTIVGISGMTTCCVVLYFILMNVLTVTKLLNSPKNMPLLTYDQVMKRLDMLIRKTMERLFITTLLPELSNDDGEVKNPTPDKNTYLNFITSIVLQVNESVDEYLKKCISMYISPSKISEYITLESKKLFDSELIKHMVRAHQSGNNNLGALTLLANEGRKQQVKHKPVRK